MKKLILIPTVILSLLLLSGCTGGDGSDSTTAEIDGTWLSPDGVTITIQNGLWWVPGGFDFDAYCDTIVDVNLDIKQSMLLLWVQKFFTLIM